MFRGYVITHNIPFHLRNSRTEVIVRFMESHNHISHPTHGTAAYKRLKDCGDGEGCHRKIMGFLSNSLVVCTLLLPYILFN